MQIHGNFAAPCIFHAVHVEIDMLSRAEAVAIAGRQVVRGGF